MFSEAYTSLFEASDIMCILQRLFFFFLNAAVGRLIQYILEWCQPADQKQSERFWEGSSKTFYKGGVFDRDFTLNCGWWTLYRHSVDKQKRQHWG